LFSLIVIHAITLSDSFHFSKIAHVASITPVQFLLSKVQVNLNLTIPNSNDIGAYCIKSKDKDDNYYSYFIKFDFFLSFIDMSTLKASKQGLARIKQARKEKGWTVYDSKWLEEASLVLDTSWEQEGVFAPGISESTWKRLLAGKHPINAEAFKAYCQVLRLDWNQIVERIGHQDWGEAPDVSFFFVVVAN
jgi:transcriptional regulator with XRE-family HTH domain